MTRVSFRDNVRSLQPFIPGKPLEELRRELGTNDILKLASNENPLGASPRAVAAARAELDMLGYYPDPSGTALKEKLADRLGVPVSLVCLGNGSEDILTLAAMICAGPGDEILITDCAFATYRVIAEKFGATPVIVPMRDWGHDLEAMLAAITDRTALVFLANPRNPTGAAVGRDAFVAFLERVPPRVLVVLDEAYYEYHAPDTDLHGTSLIAKFDNLLVTRTFSKIHGLSGLRLGYGIAHADIVAMIQRVRMPFTVNRMALAAGLAALDDDEHVQRSLAVNTAGKGTLSAFFDEVGLRRLPANGNFITALLPFEAAPLNERLLRRGLIVRPLGGFGMPRAVRVTIGSPPQLARFMRTFREELNHLRG